jgi:hypothetical protein
MVSRLNVRAVLPLLRRIGEATSIETALPGTPSLNFELMVVGIASYLRNAAINASPLSNTRWERTRRERASLLSWLGDPLKRNRELEETCR